MKRFSVRPLATAMVLVALCVFPFPAAGAEKESKDAKPAKQSAAQPEKAKAEKKPVNAAIVNGKAISYEAYEAELNLYMRRSQAQGMAMPPEARGQVGTTVINDMISRELIYQQSQKKGIKVPPEFVNGELAEIKKQFSDPSQYDAALAEMKMTEEKLKEQIVQRQSIRTLIDQEIVPKIKISDEQVKEFYDKNPKLFQRPEEVHAQHILLKIEKSADEKTRTEARKKLTDIKKKLDAGGDFAELAKANSQCPSAPQGGDLGFFSRGKMVPPFEKVAFELKPNQVSDVVETDFGYHLIKVLEHREAKTMTIEEVKPKIESNLRRRQIQTDAEKYAADLRKSAKVEVFVN
jgi:peptidyl-prolyl cis-trans isomerase C